MKKNIALVGSLVGIILVIAGFAISTPDRELSSSGDNAMPKYINGDAYNFQIEASVKSGEIAGAKASKAVYITGGSLLFFMSAFMYATVIEDSKKTALPMAEQVAYVPDNATTEE